MGIALSRTRVVDPPEWFPSDKMIKYITEARKTDSEAHILSELSEHLNQMPFLRECQLGRKPMPKWMKLFTECVAEIKAEQGPVVMNKTFKISKRCASVQFKHAAKHVTYSLNTLYYLFRSGAISFTVEKPLLRYADFATARIFPFVTASVFASLNEEFLQSFVNITGCDVKLASADEEHEISLKVHSVKYNLKSDASALFHTETPFSKVYLGLRERFEKDIFGRRVKGEMKSDLGFVIDYHGLAPVLRTQVYTQTNLRYGLELLSSCGGTLSPKPMPIYERFHLGEIPFMRGIGYRQFSPSCDNCPMGCDHYMTATIRRQFALPKDDRINFHVFGGGAVGVLSRANYSTKKLPLFTGALSGGCGLTFKVMERVFEVNIQSPILKSEKLPWASFQIGIDTLSSTKE